MLKASFETCVPVFILKLHKSVIAPVIPVWLVLGCLTPPVPCPGIFTGIFAGTGTFVPVPASRVQSRSSMPG